MWRRILDWLRRMFSAVGGVRPHPPLASDRGERRVEHTLMEGETRHVGSTADRDNPGYESGGPKEEMRASTFGMSE